MVVLRLDVVVVVVVVMLCSFCGVLLLLLLSNNISIFHIQVDVAVAGTLYVLSAG